VGTSVTNSDGAAVGLVVVMQRVGSTISGTNPSKHRHTHPVIDCAALAVYRSHKEDSASSRQGENVGICEGASEGAVDGASVPGVGSIVGINVGTAEGLGLTAQWVGSAGTNIKPSRHSQTQPSPLLAIIIVAKSHWMSLAPHASLVGKCVGAVVSTTAAAVGISDGLRVGAKLSTSDGAAVGAVVAIHRLGSYKSATKPSRHTHTHPVIDCAAFVE
jgi:hypothetical protein